VLLILLSLLSIQSSLYTTNLQDEPLLTQETRIDIGINYGNGTLVWKNSTIIPRDASVLDATRLVAQVEFESTAYGAWVIAINGVANNPDKNRFWLYWYYNENASAWFLGDVASDKFIPAERGVKAIQWYYQDTSTALLSPTTTILLKVEPRLVLIGSAVHLSGAVTGNPGTALNVTLQLSSNGGNTWQEIGVIATSPEGSFSFRWEPKIAGGFWIRAAIGNTTSQPQHITVLGTGHLLAVLLVIALISVIIFIILKKRRD
jgi:hypothetical protein